MESLLSCVQKTKKANWEEEQSTTKVVVDEKAAPTMTSAPHQSVLLASNKHSSRVLNTSQGADNSSKIAKNASCTDTDAARSSCQQETAKSTPNSGDVTDICCKQVNKGAAKTGCARRSQGEHPHAKFMQVRSKTFHTSRLRSEFIEKI